MLTYSLEDIINIWKVDCKVDLSRLEDVSADSSKLHAKYLEIYAQNNLDIREKELIHDLLWHEKRLWLDGKLTPQQLLDKEWKPDPFNGIKKPMKSEIGDWLKTDSDIQKSSRELAEFNTKKEVLREILSQIQWRHTHIKNILDSRKFESGF